MVYLIKYQCISQHKTNQSLERLHLQLTLETVPLGVYARNGFTVLACVVSYTFSVPFVWIMTVPLPLVRVTLNKNEEEINDDDEHCLFFIVTD